MNSDQSNDMKKRIEAIKNAIKSYPDFPKPGVNFRDIFPLFRQPKLMKDMIYIMKEHIQQNHPSVNCIVGLESRGFLFGTLLSNELNLPFVPIRKPGKLPGDVYSMSFLMEYGNVTLELQKESLGPESKCVIVDDLLATGGTMITSIKMIKNCGATVLGAVVLIELKEFQARKLYSEPTYSVIQL